MCRFGMQLPSRTLDHHPLAKCEVERNATFKTRVKYRPISQ